MEMCLFIKITPADGKGDCHVSTLAEELKVEKGHWKWVIEAIGMLYNSDTRSDSVLDNLTVMCTMMIVHVTQADTT